ncbi:MAG: hypothetical protein ACFUZC_07390 [Chthoniobacteraceae bacterium]
MVPLFDDPELLSPEERLRAIASLLLRGLQRFKENGGTPAPAESARKEVADDLH